MVSRRARQNLLAITRLLQHLSNGVTTEYIRRRSPWVAATAVAAASAEAEAEAEAVTGAEVDATAAAARAEVLRAALRAARAAEASVAPLPALAVLYRRLTSVPLRLAPADEVELDVYLAHLSSRRDTDSVILSLSDMRVLHGLLWQNRDDLVSPGAGAGSDDRLLRRVLMQLGPPHDSAPDRSPSKGSSAKASAKAESQLQSDMQERVTIRLLEADEELWGKATLEMDVNATYSFERMRRHHFSSLENSADASVTTAPTAPAAPAALGVRSDADAGGADARTSAHAAGSRAGENGAIDRVLGGNNNEEGGGSFRRMRSFDDFAVQTHLAVVTTPWKLSRSRALSGERRRRSPRIGASHREGGASDDTRGGDWRAVCNSTSTSTVSPSSAALQQLAPRPRMTRSNSLGLVATFSRVPNLPVSAESASFGVGLGLGTRLGVGLASAMNRRSRSGSPGIAGGTSAIDGAGARDGGFNDSPLLLAHFDSGSEVPAPSARVVS